MNDMTWTQQVAFPYTYVYVYIITNKEEAMNLRVCGGNIGEVRGGTGRSGKENTVLTYGPLKKLNLN